MNSNLKAIIIQKKLDIFIDLCIFFNILCKCEKCLQIYEDRHISFIATKEELIDDWSNRKLLEEKLNEEANEDNEENREIINEIDNCNINLLPEIKEMPIEKVWNFFARIDKI